MSHQNFADNSSQEYDYLFDLSLEEILTIRVEGATLTPLSLKIAPSAVTIFRYEQIKRTGFNYLNELMNTVPGFQSYRAAGNSAISPFSSRARRVSAPSAEILILVDGVRLNSPRSSGTGQIVPKYPLTHVARIEFIRGAGSAIYGSNAMMGVVNIITRESVNEVSGRLDIFGGYQSTILTSLRQDEVQIDFFAEFERDKGDEYSLPSTFDDGDVKTRDPKNLDMFSAKIFSDKTSLAFNYYKLSTKGFYETARTNDKYNVRKVSLQSLIWKQEINWLKIESVVLLSYSVSNFVTGSQRTPVGALFNVSVPASNDPLVKVTQYTNYEETRFQWSNNWYIGIQRSVQFGFEYRYLNAPEALLHSNYDFDAYIEGSTDVAYYSELTANSISQRASNRDVDGFYVQYQDEIINNTYLTAGGRYDYFSSIGSNFSPRVALVRELNENHSVKLLYGEAFRAPTELELNSVFVQAALGNPNLKSETVKTTELIWMGSWLDKAFSIGYFENTFENTIVRDTSDVTNLYKNESQKSTTGFEFELHYEFNKNWLLRSVFTHIEKKSDFQFREADDFSSLTVNYKYQNWNANIIVSYQGERELVSEDDSGKRIVLPSYWLGFSKLIYTYSSDVEAYAQVKNLTDNEYKTSQAPARLTEGVPNRGREVLLGISWKF